MLSKDRIIEVIRNLIKYYDAWEKALEKARDLGIDLSESPFDDLFHKAQENAVTMMYPRDKKAADAIRDTISWFIYEYRDMLGGRPMCKANAMCFEQDGTPICYDVRSLADYIIKTFYHGCGK